MAYDANSSYEPPRRGYGGYERQQAPVQNGHSNGRQQQYPEYGYDQDYGQNLAYDQQGYDQQGYGQQSYEREMGRGHPERYDGGYDQQYQALQQRRPEQQDAYGQRLPPREERQYDPRYQQRGPTKGRQHNGYEQQQRPPPGQVQQYDAPYQNGHHGRPPMNNYEQRPPREEQQIDTRYAQPQRSRDDQQYAPRHQQPRNGVQIGNTYEQPPPQIRQKTSRSQLPRQPAPQPSPPAAQPTTRPSQEYDVRSRPNPANVRQYAQQMEQQKQAMAKQRAHGMTPQPAPQPVQAPAASQAVVQSPPQQKATPAKMSMEEWKAQAKARMHAEAARPEILAWDNAFPTFPNYEHKSKGSTSAASGTGEKRHEDSPKRPSTSSGAARPSTDRNNGFSREVVGNSQQSLPRPSLERTRLSYNASREAPQSQPIVEPQRPQYGRNASSQGSSAQARQPQEWPMPESQQQTQQAQPQFQADLRQPPSRVPQMQPIDTRQAQAQRPTPAYMDHHPLSPASVPMRPSTAQAARPAQRGYHVTNPESPDEVAVPQSQQYLEVSAHTPNPRETLGDIYDVYANNQLPPPAVAPARSRDAEIESEMPDFDSAAPGGTSLLHKRSQRSTERSPYAQAAPVVPAMPSMPPQQSSQRLPPKQQGGITHGFAFGIPGEQAAQQTYQQPYRQEGYDQRQQSPLGPPVQAPFASEHVPRRSMDDARQMPYRHDPPSQHPGYHNATPANARPPRVGPMPPHMGPDMDRGYTNQTVRSDPGPGQFRGGSAPPARQALQGPPPPGPARDGGQLTRKASAPQQHNQQQRHSNPDALPSHPTPVRAGLMNGGPHQAADRPPPVRNYDSTSPPAQPQQQPRKPSVESAPRPVTKAELDQLRHAVSANPNNPKQSLVLAKKLVEASHVLASEGGRLDARSTAKNRERYTDDGHKIIKRLVGQSYPDAQFYLADCYGSGQLGLEPDPREAFNLYQAAAKGGHPEGAYRTAMFCEMGAEEGGGTRRDYAKALQWYRRAATLGDGSGMFKLGMIYLKGLLGQPRNIGDAVTWLKRASERADKENPYPLYEMAQLYESANNNPEVRNKVVADDKYALDLFQQAAQWSHKASQFRLGQAYEYGNLGLTIDNRASITYYTKAAAQGEHNAELALSGWYLTGADGILEQSDTEAYLWARKAASSEPPLAKAMFAMGYFTETGIGCPASIDEAKRWYGRAASYKFPKAQERLEELRRTGGKGARPPPVNGKLARKDQKKDEAECVVM